MTTNEKHLGARGDRVRTATLLLRWSMVGSVLLAVLSLISTVVDSGPEMRLAMAVFPAAAVVLRILLTYGVWRMERWSILIITLWSVVTVIALPLLALIGAQQVAFERGVVETTRMSQGLLWGHVLAAAVFLAGRVMLARADVIHRSRGDGSSYPPHSAPRE